MKVPAWIPALIIAAIVHGAIVSPVIPALTHSVLALRKDVPAHTAEQIILVAVIGWAVISSVWCALVANVLARRDNRWGGLTGFRLIGVVAGLTLALDVVNGPCLWWCQPAMLVVPILSYIAISNNSAPITTNETKDESSAHG